MLGPNDTVGTAFNLLFIIITPASLMYGDSSYIFQFASIALLTFYSILQGTFQTALAAVVARGTAVSG